MITDTEGRFVLSYRFQTREQKTPKIVNCGHFIVSSWIQVAIKEPSTYCIFTHILSIYPHIVYLPTYCLFTHILSIYTHIVYLHTYCLFTHILSIYRTFVYSRVSIIFVVYRKCVLLIFACTKPSHGNPRPSFLNISTMITDTEGRFVSWKSNLWKQIPIMKLPLDQVQCIVANSSAYGIY
jgi:hypothetical protein